VDDGTVGKFGGETCGFGVDVLMCFAVCRHLSCVAARLTCPKILLLPLALTLTCMYGCTNACVCARTHTHTTIGFCFQ
jgi:hypothetical protein